MADEYISKADVIDDLHAQLMYRMGSDDMKRRLDDWVKTLPSADVIPYSIDPDGTLTITVPKGTYKKINRVLVEEDGTQWGGLFYAD